MKNSRGIVWGGVLVILGMLWLLRNLDLLHIQWDEVLPYWPVLLIGAGVLLLAGGRERGATGGVAGLLIILAVFGGIVNRTQRAFNNDHDKWSFNWDDDDDDNENHAWNDGHNDDDDEDSGDENKDEGYQQERRDGNKPINGSYKYEMEDFIRKASFHLEGGAGSFTLAGNTSKLFEANTKSSFVGFLSNTSINKLDNSAIVNLKMEEGNVKIKKGEISNQAKIQLNERPVWNIDLGIGAGKGDFDFSKYKVEKLKVSTGVADMDIRLGDRIDNADVEIEAGVASITLEVPQSVGCELHLDGALNAKQMDDLDRINSGLYRSSNFASAAKKVVIHFEGGLTSIHIKRY
ncbi:LiaF transmembrane domain-containing protein [Dyadobacter sandarakinus]|uniref:LiaF transmembrane domain-containing protein n=1 Tax=Dyadobacter sandarakinus TaxID=2747268 RepID=A0ABX7ICY8_9BACT|nr:DUF5668 domain-containing protein [Dyadobacter sandarakinus]QRR03668.1 hypothetical protein HWI92_23500 [Dyadobacter sandarakinus]